MFDFSNFAKVLERRLTIQNLHFMKKFWSSVSFFLIFQNTLPILLFDEGKAFILKFSFLSS